MPDSFMFLGREIPFYSLMTLLGAVSGAIVAVILSKAKKVSLFDLLCSGVYVLFGAFIGAKLLFVLVSLRQIIELGVGIKSLLYGGFVFYGGLLGGGFALYLYIRRYRDEKCLFDIYATALPLGHAIGRVGCFLGGCCYGIPYDGPLSHTYTESVGLTPIGVPLLPIQLIEAACLLILFAVQLIVFIKKGKNRQWLNFKLYLFAYPVIRFILEFFRGDVERGVFGGISTSQIVSVIIFAVTLVVVLREKKKNSILNE